MESEDHEGLAEKLAQETDKLQQESNRLAQEINEVREDWERKRADESTPGAVEPIDPSAQAENAADPTDTP